MNTPNARTLYPDALGNDPITEESWFMGASDYQPIVTSLGTVLIQENEHGYQGDTFVLYQDEEDESRFGFLCFGWGSCSGCDALQACESYEEIDGLIGSLHSGIHWGTSAETVAYLKAAEERNEYYAQEYSGETFRSFREKALAVLEPRP